MKKSPKKHRFFHADPELQKSQKTGSSQEKTKNSLDLPQYVLTDLKKTTLFIVLFVAFLIVFYLVNNRYDFLELLKNKFF